MIKILLIIFLGAISLLNPTAKATVYNPEGNDPTAALSDNFFTYNVISPACRGQVYYKLVEIKPSGKIVREFIRFNSSYSYYMPDWTTYIKWVGETQAKNAKMPKTLFKQMLFVSGIGEVLPLENTNGVTKVSNPLNASSDFAHVPPIEGISYKASKGFESSNALLGQNYYGYMLNVSNSNNGIWPVCIGGCAFARNPMSSRIVECIEGTIKMLIVDPKPNSEVSRSVFQVFQSRVKTLVSMIIIVFVALLGLQTFLGQGLAKDGLKTVMISVIKIGIVSYFAIGDAWKSQFFYMLKGIISGASSIIYESVAGENYDGCYFKQFYYPKGFEINAIFDSLDCKAANYIGLFRDQKVPVLGNMFLTFLLYPPVVGTIVNVLITTYVTGLFNIFALMVQMYIGSSIYIMLLIFISPIVIPTMLFSSGVVKSMFDGWLKTLIGVSLSQILSVMLFVMFIPLIDSVMYGKTAEEKTALFEKSPDKKAVEGTFKIDLSPISQSDASEKTSSFTTDIWNGAKLLYPPRLDPSIYIMDVSKGCSDITSSSSYSSLVKPIVCVLKRMTGFGQIPVMPFFIRIFVLYVPTQDAVITFPLSFIYTIFVLLIISNIMISTQAVIDKLSGSTGASGMSSAQASVADMAVAAGTMTSDTKKVQGRKEDSSEEERKSNGQKLKDVQSSASLPKK